MSANHKLCVIPKAWNENWQDVLRVWVTGAGMPTLSIPDMEPAERWYGIILCDVFLHQANAIADGNPAKADKILKKMRDALKRILSKPCDWDLSAYEDYPRLPAQTEQPVPALVTSDKDSLEVLRVWIDPQTNGTLHVSLLPLGPADESAEFCVTLMMLIARNLAHWSSEDESIVFARIKSHFIDQLQTYGLEIVDGKMVGPRVSLIQSILNFFQRAISASRGFVRRRTWCSSLECRVYL